MPETAGERMVKGLSPDKTRPNWLSALRSYLAMIAVANLAWEMVQLPLYTLWRTGTTGEKVIAVVHCTAGDLLIALASLILALVSAGDRDWPVRRFGAVAAATLAFGISYTAFSEWLNIVVRKSWAYSDLMPVIDFFGIRVGMSPLLQWIAIPALAFWWCRPGRATG